MKVRARIMHGSYSGMLVALMEEKLEFLLTPGRNTDWITLSEKGVLISTHFPLDKK